MWFFKTSVINATVTSLDLHTRAETFSWLSVETHQLQRRFQTPCMNLEAEVFSRHNCTALHQISSAAWCSHATVGSSCHIWGCICHSGLRNEAFERRCPLFRIRPCRSTLCWFLQTERSIELWCCLLQYLQSAVEYQCSRHTVFLKRSTPEYWHVLYCRLTVKTAAG